MMGKRLFLIMTCLVMGLGFFSGSAEAFDDLGADWFADYRTEVYTLFHLGVASGYPDGSFRPEDSLSREEFVKLLAVAAGLDPVAVSGPVFDDVGADRWSAPWIEAVKTAGWLDADSDFFKPEAPITREDMAVLLDMALGAGAEESREAAFSDSGLMEKPEAVERVARAGILRGFPDGTFRPRASVRRIEAAIVIHRFLRNRRTLENSAFYAIDSYSQADERDRFSDIYYGWASLGKSEKGVWEAVVDGDGVFRLPAGYEILFDPSGPSGASHLMIYADPSTGLTELLAGDTEAFERSVVRIVEARGFDGVCLDFEGLRDREGRKDAYAGLVDRLGGRLDGRPVFVAVHPPNVAGFYDGYDYKALSESAQALILMAYDYQHGEDPSFSAPAPKVRGAVEELLNAGVAPERILLGLQCAGGLQWRTMAEGTAFYRPDSLDIEKALQTRKGTEAFDYNAMTGTFRYEEEGVFNLIFYENAESIGFKMDLAAFFGLRGVAFWRLGLLTDSILDLVE